MDSLRDKTYVRSDTTQRKPTHHTASLRYTAHSAGRTNTARLTLQLQLQSHVHLNLRLTLGDTNNKQMIGASGATGRSDVVRERRHDELTTIDTKL